MFIPAFIFLRYVHICTRERKLPFLRNLAYVSVHPREQISPACGSSTKHANSALNNMSDMPQALSRKDFSLWTDVKSIHLT